MAPLLNAHAASHFTHGGEAGEVARAATQRLVGECGDTGVEQSPGERFAGGEVQVGEENLPPAKQRELGGLRFLHLDDQVGLLKHLGGRSDNLGPILEVVFIGDARANPRAPFHQHPMPEPGQFFDPRGDETDAIFIRLDLLGNADNHAILPSAGQAGRSLRRRPARWWFDSCDLPVVI